MRDSPSIAALVLCAVALPGCVGTAERQEGPNDSPSVKAVQLFRPQDPYAKEGSAGVVTLGQRGTIAAAVGPVPSEPGDRPQTLGAIAVPPGSYKARGSQIPCAADTSCPRGPYSFGRLKRLRVSCDANLQVTEEGGGVFMYVDPARGECRLEPTDGTVEVECSEESDLIDEFVAAYPTIDIDRPGEVCAIELRPGKILDLFRIDGTWGDMRRDEISNTQRARARGIERSCTHPPAKPP